MGIGKRGNQVHVIDFGLAKKYADPKPTFIPPIALHDDLESLAYVLMDFLYGALLWQGLKAATKKQKYGSWRSSSVCGVQDRVPGASPKAGSRRNAVHEDEGFAPPGSTWHESCDGDLRTRWASTLLVDSRLASILDCPSPFPSAFNPPLLVVFWTKLAVHTPVASFFSDTDQEREQMDQEQTDGEDFVATPFQSRSSAHPPNDLVDVFDEYWYEGQHSVIIDLPTDAIYSFQNRASRPICLGGSSSKRNRCKRDVVKQCIRAHIKRKGLRGVNIASIRPTGWHGAPFRAHLTVDFRASDGVHITTHHVYRAYAG
ncbi:hypothetical protein BJV77DRAFT_1130543 [Russula vinacea]|nr:hypothetical protein BJV77DRAFT_1130543 [Russula vinacea]